VIRRVGPAQTITQTVSKTASISTIAPDRETGKPSDNR